MVFLELLRPFTLLPPMIGMISGALSAIGTGRRHGDGTEILGSLVAGVAMAALLNGGSNVLNQIHDLAIDRINRPGRPLPSGRVSLRAARVYTLVLYALAIGLSALVRPAGRPELLAIVLVTAFLTWAYSAPPLRLRRFPLLSPLTIALPRGGLLKVAGWATIAPVFSDAEPWILGALFFLFVLGGASIKDFADTEGDRRNGVTTLPIRFGFERAARMMAPFYVAPWILFALLCADIPGGGPVLSVRPWAGVATGLVLALAGSVAAVRLVRGAEGLGDATEGRGAWRDFYRLMMLAQVLIGGLYLIH